MAKGEPNPGAEGKPDDRLVLGFFRSRQDAVKFLGGICLGAAIVLYCLKVAAEGKDPAIQILICFLGGQIGWIIGLYLTPDSEGEKKRFGEAAKLWTALAAGFGLGKADDIRKWLEPYLAGSPDVTSLRLALFFCCLLVGGLFTYMGRLHVRDGSEVLRGRREKLLLETQESLDKLLKLN